MENTKVKSNPLWYLQSSIKFNQMLQKKYLSKLLNATKVERPRARALYNVQICIGQFYETALLVKLSAIKMNEILNQCHKKNACAHMNTASVEQLNKYSEFWINVTMSLSKN